MPSNACEENCAAVQIYTPGKGWTYGAPLPFGRGGMGKCVCYYGKCYVFGGEVDTNTAPSTSKKVSSSRTVYSVDVYDIETNSWGQAKVCKAFFSNLPVAVSLHHQRGSYRLRAHATPQFNSCMQEASVISARTPRCSYMSIEKLLVIEGSGFSAL
jgi:hypothetical protein